MSAGAAGGFFGGAKGALMGFVTGDPVLTSAYVQAPRLVKDTIHHFVDKPAPVSSEKREVNFSRVPVPMSKDSSDDDLKRSSSRFN